MRTCISTQLLHNMSKKNWNSQKPIRELYIYFSNYVHSNVRIDVNYLACIQFDEGMAECSLIMDKHYDRMSDNYILLFKTFVGKRLISSTFITTNVGMDENHFKCMQVASYFVLSSSALRDVRIDYIVSDFSFVAVARLLIVIGIALRCNDAL